MKSIGRLGQKNLMFIASDAFKLLGMKQNFANFFLKESVFKIKNLILKIQVFTFMKMCVRTGGL